MKSKWRHYNSRTEWGLHWSLLRSAVVIASDGRCWHCNVDLIDFNAPWGSAKAAPVGRCTHVLEIDHARPHSRGGSWSPKNYVAACKPCNAGRQDNLSWVGSKWVATSDCVRIAAARLVGERAWETMRGRTHDALTGELSATVTARTEYLPMSVVPCPNHRWHLVNSVAYTECMGDGIAALHAGLQSRNIPWAWIEFNIGHALAPVPGAVAQYLDAVAQLPSTISNIDKGTVLAKASERATSAQHAIDLVVNYDTACLDGQTSEVYACVEIVPSERWPENLYRQIVCHRHDKEAKLRTGSVTFATFLYERQWDPEQKSHQLFDRYTPQLFKKLRSQLETLTEAPTISDYDLAVNEVWQSRNTPI
jgi:HNH endonuclease